MKKPRTLVEKFILISAFAFLSSAYPQNEKAHQIINKSLEVMGGEAFLSSINSIQTEGKQVYYLIDQSINPDGPYITTVNNYKSIELPFKNKLAYWKFYNQSITGFKFIVDGEAYGLDQEKGISFKPYGSDKNEELYLAPEKILFLGKENSPTLLKDTLIHDISHTMVGFKWMNYPIRMFFNRNSHFLKRVEITRHYIDNTPFLFGDSKVVHEYSFWKTIGKQLHYPAQKDIYLEGKHYQSITIDSVFVNLPVKEESLTIPDSIKHTLIKTRDRVNMFKNVPILTSEEIAKDIFFIKGKFSPVGSYNSWFLKTSEGIIIIEAPVSSSYLKGEMNEVKTQFPNEKIKAVITTSDGWPHIGGLREYVANNIPIYMLELNEKLIRRLLRANYYSNPDSLQKNRVNPQLIKVSEKQVVGDYENPIELYPIRTETGERMMMVYFPNQKLLYSSDLVQPGLGEKFFMPQYIGEIIEAIKREKLKVEKIIGIHQSIINYEELTNFLK